MQKTSGFARNSPLAHAKLACDWQPVTYKLYLSGRKSHIICTWVAASWMQIVPVWPPVACNMNKNGRNLHATGGHAGAICVKGHIYIIINFFSISMSTSSTMLLTIQLTALGYLVWKMSWYYGWQSHTEANFAHASGQLRAKPPVFCKHASRTILWIKKWGRH